VARTRRLRRLVVDEALLRRRAAGESLRAIAPAYDVAHTTLARYFRRPEVVLELREAGKRLRLERRGLAERRAREREVQQRARAHAIRDRELEEWAAAHRPRRSANEARLDQHDAADGGSSSDDYSANDRRAADVVAKGGGVDAVIESTGLRSWENVRRLDAQIMARALANGAQRSSSDPLDGNGLRRLVPDEALISRRAIGETLRRLARDYDVSHTTLSRYFQRPEIAKELRAHQRLQRGGRRSKALPADLNQLDYVAALTAETHATILRIRCPVHGRKAAVDATRGQRGQVRFRVSFCCDTARKEFRHQTKKSAPAVATERSLRTR